MTERPTKRRWFHRKPKQTTWCWCPTCGRDLCSTDSFKSDTDEGVLYECSWCEHRSLWDFDTFPCPVLIDGPAVSAGSNQNGQDAAHDA